MIAFGWSAGDIAAAINVLTKVVNGLKETGGAASQFRQVVQDFRALELVLEFIEDLDSHDAVYSVAQALCARSQSSRNELNNFLDSVSKYDKSLGRHAGGKWHQNPLRKTQWVLFMTKEARKLQDVLGPQMQSINMLLHARQMTSLSRLNELGRSNHEAICSKASTLELESAKSFQQIISCGETLKQQGFRQIKIMDSLDMTLQEVTLATEAGLTHQLYTENEAERRAARAESHLSQLYDTTQNLQHITGISHTLLNEGRVKSDCQAAQVMDLLSSINATVSSLDDKKKVPRNQESAKKAISSHLASEEVEEITYQVIKVLCVMAAGVQEILGRTIWICLRLMLLFRLLAKAIPRLPKLLLSDSIKLEDALGRSFKLPHLYFQHWKSFDGFIQAQFETHPGERQVRSGRYLIMKRVKDGRQTISDREWNEQVAPGSTLYMSVILDKLRIKNRLCPRVLCKGVCTFEDGSSEAKCLSCGLSCHLRRIPFRTSRCRRPLCSGSVKYTDYECVTCPVCSLRFFPEAVVQNTLLSPTLETTTEPRITEVDDDGQEVEDDTSSDFAFVQSLSLTVPAIAMPEQSFEPSLPMASMTLRESSSQCARNLQLRSQLDRIRATQVRRRRLKLELLEDQTREREELDARESEANDISLLKRVHIISSEQSNEDDERDMFVTKQRLSPGNRLLEARIRLFADRDHHAFLNRGLTPKIELDAHCATWAFVEAPRSTFVGMVILVLSEGGKFPYKKHSNHPFHGKFVVVDVSDDHTSCLLITTYGGQGTTAQDVVASDHAVIHMEGKRPFVLPEECGLNAAIAVKSDDLLSELEPMSRICYSRVYNISKRVGCRRAGSVRGGSLLRLQQDFAQCFTHSHALSKAASTGNINAVKNLLAAGADTDAVVGTAGNALYEATKAGHYEIVQMLLARGATAYLGLAEDNPDSALLQAMVRGNSRTAMDLLRQSICLQCVRDTAQIELVQVACRLLDHYPTAMHHTATRWTQLMAAVKLSQFDDFVERILDKMCSLLRPVISVLILNCIDMEDCVLDKDPLIGKHMSHAKYQQRFRTVRFKFCRNDES